MFLAFYLITPEKENTSRLTRNVFMSKNVHYMLRLYAGKKCYLDRWLDEAIQLEMNGGQDDDDLFKWYYYIIFVLCSKKNQG